MEGAWRARLVDGPVPRPGGHYPTEEDHKPESIFDFVQGITAMAPDRPHQDVRLDLEARAKKLLDRVV